MQQQQQDDDMRVIQEVLQGQQNAYAILVNKYQSYVFTLALRYVDDRSLAEELAQDVFIKAYRSLADFKGNSRFSTWLYTIVNTTCISLLRKKKNNTVLLEQERMATVMEHHHNDETADIKLHQKYQRRMLTEAINKLPEDDARVIFLFYQAEQSIEEVGSIMDITTSNVKVRLHRSRQKLKEILETKFTNEWK